LLDGGAHIAPLLSHLRPRANEKKDMSGNLLVINVDIREVRVALIEAGIIAELHIERLSHRSTLGNICLGTVSRVLPGMQAAFIDIGQERAAFLHVEDLIRPDDFETYLAAAGKAPAPAEGEADQDDGAEAPSGGQAETTVADGAAEEGEGRSRRRRRRRSRRRRDRPDEAAEPPTAEDSSAGEAAEPEGSSAGEATEPEDSSAGEAAEPEDSSAGEAAEPEDSSAGEAADGADASELGDDDATVVEDEVDVDEPVAPEDSIGGEDDEPLIGEAPSSPGVPLTEDSTPGGLPAVDLDGEQQLGDEIDIDETFSSTPEDLPPVVEEEPTEDGSAEPADEPADEGLAAAAETDEVTEPDKAKTVSESDEVAGSAGSTEDATEGAEPKRQARRTRRAQVSRSGRTRTTRTTKPTATANKRESASRSTRRSQSSGRERQRGRSSRSRSNDKSRISKSTPIREVVREGQQVVVQVTKEPIGSKGARVSSHVSLPGRYVVYLPTVDHIGISKRIGSDKERSRLRASIESVKPPNGGLVVRTMAEGLTKKQLKNDVGYLVRLWDEIAKNRSEAAKAPTMLYEELDLVLKTARDLFTEDVGRIVIDNREQYGRLRRFVEMFMPERADDIELYEGREPVFDAYGIEDEMGRALSRKVPLNSGGHLIIDQAEALTAIDVNTGRYVGKGSKDLEDTILATNLEAVQEIAYQLRFRNIGGLIILDLIDMERAGNREKVRRRLEALLAKDKAKTTLNRISDLGLIEMTRKRTRESLGRLLHEPCFYCDGTGQLMSKETIAYEILRQIRREQGHLKGYKITVNAHPAIIDLLKTEEREAVGEVERMFMRRINLVAHKEYHIEQFDLQGA